MIFHAEDKIRVLIRAAFPDRHDLEKPHTGDDADRSARIQAYRTFKTELEKMSVEELDSRYMEYLRVHRERDQQAAKRNDEMAYFSRPEATANFPVWCALEKWNIDEATALLLEKDPLKVNWSNVGKIEWDSIFRSTYDDLRQRLLRAREDGRLSDPDKAQKFVDWAREVGFAVPAGLNVKAARSIVEEGDMPAGKRRNSMLKMILGMAMTKYGYEPNAAKNAATTRIVEDLKALDLGIDAQTALSLLREAAEQLDPKPKL